MKGDTNMVIQETICKCDICGAEMRESETGHRRWPCYLVLGSNLDEADTKKYDDVCNECTVAISSVIDKRRTDKSVLTKFFENKLKEL